MSKAPLPILYPLITDRKRYKPSEKLLKFLFKISKNFCQISKLSNSRNLHFKLLEELEISHLFFGFTSFCMESQKQLYHNPLTRLPSTNPHNWACKNSPCPKSNANPSHTPPPPTRNDSSIMRDYWKSCSLTRQREADLQTHHFTKQVCETSLRTSQQKHAER